MNRFKDLGILTFDKRERVKKRIILEENILLSGRLRFIKEQKLNYGKRKGFFASL